MEAQDLLAFSNTIDIDNPIQYHPKLGQSVTLDLGPQGTPGHL